MKSAMFDRLTAMDGLPRGKYDDVPAVAAAKAAFDTVCAEAKADYQAAEQAWIEAGQIQAQKVKRASNVLRAARLQAEIDDIKATLA